VSEILSFFNSPFFTSLMGGFSTGMGITLGAWMINHNVIKRVETLETKVRDKIRA
jgi:hypothetical protein